MMTGTPVIFLAFANDADAHLALLKEESRGINRALREADRKGFVRVLREEQTQSRDIYESLLTWKDQLGIFHYAGHAGGLHLQLEDGVGDASGIAQLLGDQEAMQLVFLNGCSTEAQVQLLFDKGVRSVIATSSAVQDRKACEFGIAFYEALANRRTIKQAFRMAVGLLKTKFGPAMEADIIPYRKVNWGDKLAEGNDLIPWALYVNDESVLNYRLPAASVTGLPREVLQYIGSSFTANRYILTALDDMCRYNPDISAQMYEQRGETIIKKDSKDYPELIIKNFPWPIGSQIRLLQIHAHPNKERLQTLISTYVITCQTLYYILLSDLWGHQHHNIIQLSKKISLDWKKTDFPVMDFLGSFIQLMEDLPENCLLYVEEFKDFFEAYQAPDSRLKAAHSYLHGIQQQLVGAGEMVDFERICLKVEQAVALVLKNIGFMARFRMMTVRNVLIEQPRFAQLNYELQMGPLNASEAVHLRLYQDTERRRKASFTDTHSVVLVADEDLMHQGLNLSPFIIDKNTFVQVKKSVTTEEDTEDVAHIFLLGWADENKLTWLTVNHNLFVALADEKGTDQIHTDMRQTDFKEGRNLGDDLWEDAFGLDQDTDSTSDSPKVFELLLDQYRQFLEELGGVGG